MPPRRQVKPKKPAAKKPAAKKIPAKQYLTPKALQDRRAKAKAVATKTPTPKSPAAGKPKAQKAPATTSSENMHVASQPSPEVKMSRAEWVAMMIKKDPYFLMDYDPMADSSPEIGDKDPKETEVENEEDIPTQPLP